MDTIKVAVVSDGQTTEYKVTPFVQVSFERHFAQALASAFGPDKENRLEHMYWLAWQSARAANGTKVGEFDDWLKEIDGVDLGDAEPAAPFDPATSDG
jgi:hypothetical protein